MLSPDPNTRLIVSPCTRIEKTTTAYVMVTPASSASEEVGVLKAEDQHFETDKNKEHCVE